jgi:hypothetical protein
MINHEGTMPNRLESYFYSVNCLIRNDVAELEDPIQYFHKILDDIIHLVVRSRQELVCQHLKASPESHSQLTQQLSNTLPTSVAKCLDQLNMKPHYNNKANMIRHLPVLQ